VKIVDETVQARFPALPEKFSDTLLERYVTKFIEALLNGLREVRERLREERAAVQAPFDANQQLFLSQEKLHETASLVNAALLGLAVQENAILPPAMLEDAIEAVSGNSAWPADVEEHAPQDKTSRVLASDDGPRS
jgi:hypothetical protein